MYFTTIGANCWLGLATTNDTPHSRQELEDLLADLDTWEQYGSARGILGRRFRVLRNYLVESGRINQKGEPVEDRHTTAARFAARQGRLA